MNRPAPAATYRALLRLPSAAPFLVAATVARLSYGTVTLAVLLSVRHASGSLAASGWALGGYAVSAFLMPAKAGLIDRFGPRRSLAAMSAGFGFSLLALAFCVADGIGSPAVLVPVATAAGLCAPPLGPTTRARWAAIAPQPELRRMAYSLDAVLEEFLYVGGPVLVAVLARVSVVAPLIATAVLALSGTAGMIWVGVGSGRRPQGAAIVRGSGGVDRRLTGLVAIMAAVGLALSPIDIAVLARAGAASTGYLLAAMSGASIVGGLVWGRLAHRGGDGRRLAGLFALGAVGLAISTVAVSTPALAVGLVIVGLPSAPLFTVAYLAADRLGAGGGDAVSVRAGTWINTGFNAGMAVGSAVAGVLVQSVGAEVALAAGGGVLGLAALAAARSSVLDVHVTSADSPFRGG